MRIRKHPRSSIKKSQRRRAISMARNRAQSRGLSSMSRRSLAIANGGRTCSDVSEKLKTLKELIPSQNRESKKTDQLFQETADYIIHLRTQVAILQRLIDLYGPAEMRQNLVS